MSGGAGALVAVLTVAAGAPLGAATLQWTQEHRLSESSRDSRTTLNFAHATAVDGSGGVHVVWYERGDGDAAPSVHYRRGGDGWGRTQRLSGAEGGEYPSIAASRDRLLVVWQSGGEDGRFRMRSSVDGGATWSPASALSETGSVVHASIAAGGAWLHVVWVDSHSGDAEVYYRRSPDGGDSWQPPTRLSAAGDDSWTPSLAAEGDLVAVAWVDTRDGNEEEYVRVSTDGGALWGDETRLTSDAMNSWAPSLAIAGGVIHLAWFDQRDNEFHLRDAEAMLDQAMRLVGLEPEPAPDGILVPDPGQPGRMTFYSQAFQHRVQEKSGAIGTAVHPWVAQGGDPRRVAQLMGEFNRRMWIASREWELYYVRSRDQGATWSSTMRLTEAEGSPSRPNLAGVGDTLHLVWFDDRHGHSEIFYKSSPDAGVTWSEDQRLTEAAGASEQPMVAAGSDGLVHVVWHDDRAGPSDIYYLRGEP